MILNLIRWGNCSLKSLYNLSNHSYPLSSRAGKSFLQSKVHRILKLNSKTYLSDIYRRKDTLA